eukprot:scaffold2914_cov178-Amphora_coffeaeformis.AAC.11
MRTTSANDPLMNPLLMDSANAANEAPPPSEEEEEEESPEERQIPPLSQSWDKLQSYGCRTLFRKPLLLSLGSWLGYFCAMQYMYEYGESYYLSSQDNNQDTPAARSERLQSVFLTAFVMLAVILLADAYYLWQGAMFWERRVVADMTSSSSPPQLNDSNNTTTNDNNNEPQETDACVNYVLRLSRQVDRSFSSSGLDSSSSHSNTNTTFVLGLVWALFAVACWGTMAACASMLWMATTQAAPMEASRYYFGSNTFIQAHGDPNLSSMDEFGILPKDIQAWILDTEKDFVLAREDPTVSYAPLLDNSLAFTSQSCQRNTYYRQSDDCTTGIAMFSANDSLPNGSADIVQLHALPFSSQTGHWERYNEDIWLVGFPREAPHESWCAGFVTQYGKVIEDDAMCYDRNGQLTKFPGKVVEDDDKKIWRGGSPSHVLFHATDDSLWIIRTIHNTMDDRKLEKTRALIKYDVTAIERTVVLQYTMVSNYGLEHGTGEDLAQSSPTWSAILWGASFVSLVGTTVYLYMRDVSSCTVPSTILLQYLLHCILLSDLWTAVLLAVLAGGLVQPLRKRQKIRLPRSWAKLPTCTTRLSGEFVTTEMLLWAQYTMLTIIGNTLIDFAFYNGGSDETISLVLLIVAVLAANALILNHPVFELVGLLAGLIWQRYRLHVIVHCRRGAARAAGAVGYRKQEASKTGEREETVSLQDTAIGSRIVSSSSQPRK